MKHADRQTDGWADTTFLLCIHSKSIKEDVPYFLAHKTHFFSLKMWPKFELHLMRRGSVLFPNLWIPVHLLYNTFIVR